MTKCNASSRQISPFTPYITSQIPSFQTTNLLPSTTFLLIYIGSIYLYIYTQLVIVFPYKHPFAGFQPEHSIPGISKMDEMEGFSHHFIGMKVEFTDGHTGTWALTEKLSDTCSQLMPFDVKLLGGSSSAYGTFVCANVNNPGETAIMRIFMQWVPRPIIQTYWILI